MIEMNVGGLKGAARFLALVSPLQSELADCASKIAVLFKIKQLLLIPPPEQGKRVMISDSD